MSGSLLGDTMSPEIAVLAEEGSLQNKVFSSKRHQCADLGQDLWSTHTSHVTQHITRSSIQSLESHFQGAVFHCEDKHASSLRIFCPCLYRQAIDTTFLDPAVFTAVDEHPDEVVSDCVFP